MSTGRRGRRHVEEEHVNHERWLVSYSDMITVLMALFIVLFAISQVDQEKYIQLRESLSAGFADMGSPSVLDGTDGTLDGQSATQADPGNSTAGMVDGDLGLGDQGADPQAQQDASVDAATLAAAQAEADHLEQIRDQIATLLAQSGLDGAVRFRIDDRGLVLGLVAVGDAAGFLDPFTGEGLHRALVSARLAAGVVLGNEGLATDTMAYDRAMRRRFRAKDLVSLLVQAFLARPLLFEYAARRLADREPVRETLGQVIGDLVPASRALDPRLLGRLLAP